MSSYRLAHLLAGAAAVAAISFATYRANGPELIAGLERQAREVAREAGAGLIDIRFETDEGWLTRHPHLGGGKGLPDEIRSAAAAAIVEVPGIGGVRWEDPGVVKGRGGGSGALHCQEDVEAIVKARSIRFADSSADIDQASQTVLNEVASALLPCVGSIIAITGHTDNNGDVSANLALSRARAEAVRWALIGRGIPADGLRATGKGSEEPIEGLDPSDSANRRIEFSVIETAPLLPTPIDTPGPG